MGRIAENGCPSAEQHLQRRAETRQYGAGSGFSKGRTLAESFREIHQSATAPHVNSQSNRAASNACPRIHYIEAPG